MQKQRFEIEWEHLCIVTILNVMESKIDCKKIMNGKQMFIRTNKNLNSSETIVLQIFVENIFNLCMCIG